MSFRESKRQKRMRNQRPLSKDEQAGAGYMVKMLGRHIKTHEQMEEMLKSIPNDGQRIKVRELLLSQLNFPDLPAQKQPEMVV